MKVERTTLYLGILKELEWNQQNNLRIRAFENIIQLGGELVKLTV